MPPDVKWNSSTPGKIDPLKIQQNNHKDQTVTSNNCAKPIISTLNLSQNIPTGVVKPVTMTWNDDSAYPILDELTRMAKVSLNRYESSIILDYSSLVEQNSI